ncbi:MAG: 3-phosphoshikimate 1-carboxyvinyltransferase [Acidobacteria bacterium]|nr:3-phosphoshikimate 1-carboxyvinyltransferase [Acidobacteriota bacterium]
MECTVHPSTVSGTVGAPASKSVLLRALAAGLLADGRTTLSGVSCCDDVRAGLGILRGLGAVVMEDEAVWTVRGPLDPREQELDCRESGLCLRMFAPLAALSEREITLTVRGSLASRPVTMLERPLAGLGVRCTTNEGLPPVRVRGPLRSGTVAVDGRLSSQFLTGMLMALPLAGGRSILRVRQLRSRPYIDLTLNLLRDFGIQVSHEKYETFDIPGGQRYQPRAYAVEGDWSGAAFPLVAGALAGDVTVTGLDAASVQADRAIAAALTAAGALIRVTPASVRAAQGDRRAFSFDATDCPDLFPPLVALAVHCPGVTILHGVHRLRHKESDRAAALHDEFRRLGAAIAIDGDVMTVRGGPLTGGTVHSRHDHRIAMAAAVAALAGGGPVTIGGARAVEKSYPAFYRDLERLGATVNTPDD